LLRSIRIALPSLIGAAIVALVVEYVWKQASQTLPEPVTAWGGRALIVGFVLLLILLAYRRLFRDKEIDVFEETLRFDENLLMRLPSLVVHGTERKEVLKRLLRGSLEDAMEIFGEDIVRGWVFEPQGDYLVPLETSDNVSEKSKKEAKFYIGDCEEPLTAETVSVAGRAYCSGGVRVVHFDKRNGQWVPDTPDHRFTERDSPARLGYRSYVAVPIRGSKGNMGVLCFDSSDRSTFDPVGVQEFLEKIQLRIGRAMRLFQKLEELDADTS
jgi:hypothetical protein